MKKNLLICLLSIIAYGPVWGQRASTKKFKRDLVVAPILPVQNVEKVAFRLYFPDDIITMDTLVKHKRYPKYLGDDIKRNLEDGRAHKAIELVEDQWDIVVEVAFQPARIDSKQVLSSGGNNPNYSYRVRHKMPTFVRISDQAGQVLDVWEESAPNSIDYGNGSERERDEGDSVTTISWTRYFSTDDLEEAFQKDGFAVIHRKALKMQLGRIIDNLYRRIYFLPKQDKLEIATAKSRNYEYPELDKAQEMAIAALEGDNLDGLAESIAIWKTHLAKAELANTKAFINLKIAGALYRNLAIAYMYQGKYDDALYHLLKSQQLVGEKGDNNAIYNLIVSRARGALNNPGMVATDAQFEPTRLKKGLTSGIRQNTYPLLVQENRLDEFVQAYERFSAAVYQRIAPNTLAKVAAERAEAEAGRNIYAEMVQQPGTKFAFISLNPLVDESLVGGPMPTKITAVGGLHTLAISGMEYTSVAADIGNMTTLRKLILSGNSFSEVPESIGQLTELTTLNLSDNQLTTLPASIQNCTKLKKVVLKGNNISSAEMEKIKGWLPPKCKVK